MTKLLILDKDGTLVAPKSGGTFVQHPEDQQLLPGVAEAIARYAADGWHMAIASNHGGCMVRECLPLDFPVGAYYVEKSDPSNYPVRIIRKNDRPDGVVLHTATPRRNGKDYLYFEHYSKVHFQYKTLEDAIAEMRYCMSLLNPYYPAKDMSAYFCPDDGETCAIVRGHLRYYPLQWAWVRDGEPPRNYRKPGAGMLETAIEQHRPMFSDLKAPPFWHSENCLMVGDREDFFAAIAAGTPFLWAEEWRAGE